MEFSHLPEYTTEGQWISPSEGEFAKPGAEFQSPGPEFASTGPEFPPDGLDYPALEARTLTKKLVAAAALLLGLMSIGNAAQSQTEEPPSPSDAEASASYSEYTPLFSSPP